MSDAITLESANDTVKAIGSMIGEIKSGMQVMDNNILGDTQVLFNKQLDILDAIKNLSLDMAPPPAPKVGKVRLVLMFGAGIYVGVKLSEKSRPKKWY